MTKFKQRSIKAITSSILLTLFLCITLQGCAGLVIGAAGGTALIIHDRRDAETQIKDQKIESAATDKIYSDEKLKKKIHANVTSYNQIVLVTGEVHSAELRDHAISILQNIPDIKRIHNELVVSGLTSFASRSGDSIITSKIKTQMIGKKGLDATRVKVVTENKKVFLMGLVTERESELAVEIARNVKDVKQVVKIFEIVPEEATEPNMPAPVADKSQ